MSRQREISTEISNDKRLALLAIKHGPMPVMLYTLAIPHADDWGRLPGDPMEFGMKVFPALLSRLEEIEQAINALAEAGLWRLYTVGGSQYIAFPREKWFRYQNYINAEKRDYDGSKYPAPPDEEWQAWENRPSANRGKKSQEATGSQDDSRFLPEKAKNPQESPRIPASPSPSPSPSPTENTPLSPPDGGQESAEDRQNGRAETASPSESESPAFEPAPRRASRNRSVVTLSPEQQKRFDSFFASYPNREKKQEAVRAWARINPDAELLAAMAAGLKRWKNSERWTKDGGRFVMLAATWLNQACWNDEPASALPTVPSRPAPLPDDETLTLQKRYLDGIPSDCWPDLEKRARQRFKVKISNETAYQTMQRIWRHETQNQTADGGMSVARGAA